MIFYACTFTLADLVLWSRLGFSMLPRGAYSGIVVLACILLYSVVEPEPNYCTILKMPMLVLGPSRTLRRVSRVGFLHGSGPKCVFFSTPVTRIHCVRRGRFRVVFLHGSARTCAFFTTPVTRIDVCFGMGFGCVGGVGGVSGLGGVGGA